MDEVDSCVMSFKRIENCWIEDENYCNAICRLGGLGKRTMIGQAKVAADPAEGTLHSRFLRT
jgi:hypothetical protein